MALPAQVPKADPSRSKSPWQTSQVAGVVKGTETLLVPGSGTSVGAIRLRVDTNAPNAGTGDS